MIILSHELKKFEIVYTPQGLIINDGVMEMEYCPICEKEHHVLYAITRKKTKQFGHFLAFLINGEWELVDPTLPHVVSKIPRGAIRVPDDITHYSWLGKGWDFQLLDESGRVIRDISSLCKIIGENI